MNALQQKAAYVANITGLDIAAESSGDAEKQSRIYLNVSCGDVSGRISLPGDSSPQLVGLVAAYFADTDEYEGGLLSAGLYRILKGVETPARVRSIDEMLAGRQYFVALLITEPQQWGELVSLLSALSTDDDVIIKTSMDAALYLKSCDGSYDGSEELAEILYRNITADRNMALIVCSGGKASGVGAIVQAYSRATTAWLRMTGNVRHYRDCALAELMKKLPAADVREYLSYLTDGRKITELSDELIETARVFLDCDLQVSTAAKALYLHRNTLSARLDKIADATGLDIRRYRQAQLFDRIVELMRIVKNM